MNILTVNTGDEKLDKAYKNMQVHICSFEHFDSFNSYFKGIVKDTDIQKLNEWLLKVLFWEFKYGRDSKHKFDVLLDNLKVEDKQKMENWLENELRKRNIK